MPDHRKMPVKPATSWRPVNCPESYTCGILEFLQIVYCFQLNADICYNQVLDVDLANELRVAHFEFAPRFGQHTSAGRCFFWKAGCCCAVAEDFVCHDTAELPCTARIVKISSGRHKSPATASGHRLRLWFRCHDASAVIP